MASAIEVPTLGSSGVALLRCGMFSLSGGCAVLLLMHGVPWAAMAAVLSGAAVWARSEAARSTRLRIHNDGGCELVGPAGPVEAQLDSVFSGWGFALLRLKAPERQQVLLVATATLMESEAGRFRRWLKLAPRT